MSATTMSAAAFSAEAAASLDEAALVRATLAGEPRAFEQLMGAHGRRVFNFLYQFTRNRHDAEDLAQQTFIKAFNNLQRFDCSRPMINWLLTIARRTALNHFRAAKRWEEMPENLASPGDTPAHAAEDQDQKNKLWERARRVLSQREFEVLWLRFAEDLSTEETARVVGLTTVHVKVIVFRAKRALQKGLSS
jgi:RNA polymerase sigma-70 factor (ECF subfamily)